MENPIFANLRISRPFNLKIDVFEDIEETITDLRYDVCVFQISSVDSQE